MSLAAGGVGGPDRGQHGKEHAGTGGGRIGDIIPVAAKEIVEIGGVHRGMVIGGQRFFVLLDQPPGRFLIGAEGYDDHQRHEQREAEANQHVLVAAVEDAVADGVLLQLHDDGGQAQEAQHQSLGLDKDGQHIQGQHQGPFAVEGKVRHQHQQDAEHAVDLAPGGAVEDRGRIKGEQHSQQAAKAAGIAILTGEAVDQQAGDQVTGHGDELVHEGRAEYAVEQPGCPTVEAKHIDIARRIIAPVGLVEHCRTDAGHRIAPCGEAVDVHLIALDIQCDHHAKQGCDRHAGNGEEGHGLPGTCRVCWVELMLVQLQVAHDPKGRCSVQR